MARDLDSAGYGIVMVTASSRDEAEAIAHRLIEAKLAACVSLMPIRSIYSWQGQVHNEEEWQLFVKTDLAQFETIEATIREIHSYEVPEIIGLPLVAGSQPYLQWIWEQLN